MEKLKLGMVGGGSGAFIGAVHRRAAIMDGRIELVAGALSSTPEKSLASGEEVGLATERNYESYQQMLEVELSLPTEERVDLVSVVTPNHLHFPVAHAFVEAGFNVVVDKPMVHDSGQAKQLIRAVEQSGVTFCVTYQYTGYPMVKQARHMVREGYLGEIRKVVVEYNQGWLASQVEESGDKQASWRTDPEKSGLAGTMGDIGSHAENLVSTVTGLEAAEICADLSTFVPGRRLDDDANMLIRYTNGARGVLVASQISAGEENSLTLKVYGTEGGLQWRQENPNYLRYLPDGAPEKVYKRGNDYLCDEAIQAGRIPPGHPEAFIEAFANVYAGVDVGIRAKKEGSQNSQDNGGADSLSFPTVYDGARGVHFIEKTVESAQSEKKWTAAQRETASSLNT